MRELHVEQGPVLESELLDLGIVEHVAGCRRLELRLTGETRQSGTTPMALRRDALAAAAEMILASERHARRLGPPAMASAGYVRATPGAFNAVAGSCELGIEVRHIDRARLVELGAEVGRQCREIGQGRGLEVVVEEVSRQDPVALSPALAEAAETRARGMRLACRRMVSGAAHDAMVFARAGIPALLLFVPSRHGVSHSPEEFTEPRQLEVGQRFLFELARWLSEARA